MGDRAQKEAWVTLATNDSYALGCLVLGNSLRRVATSRQLVCMYTEGVSEQIKGELYKIFDSLVEVSMLDSKDTRNLSLLGRPDLNVTFTKIHCWELTQYEKCVFLDADTLIIQHCDELFDREELSAAPDAGWPDCFNSGVFVFRPSNDTYNRLINFALTTGSFDGGDQGLLNSFYNTWATEDIHKHLPFIYNVVSQAFYSYLPAFTQFRENIKIVHFIGAIKPWHHPYNTATKTVTAFPETGHSQEFLQLWWNIFMDLVQPTLDPSLGGLVGELAQMKIGAGEGADYLILDDRERRLAWERGHADYLGADSFANIMRKLDEKMASLPISKEQPKKEEVELSPVAPPPTEVKHSTSEIEIEEASNVPKEASVGFLSEPCTAVSAGEVKDAEPAVSVQSVSGEGGDVAKIGAVVAGPKADISGFDDEEAGVAFEGTLPPPSSVPSCNLAESVTQSRSSDPTAAASAHIGSSTVKPQVQLAPLQIDQKLVSTEPSVVQASPKSPPPPVAEKPVSPTVSSGMKSPPVVPDKPTFFIATGIDKPGARPAKPVSSVSAFAARFQQPAPTTAPGVGSKPMSPTSPIASKPTFPVPQTGAIPKTAVATSPVGSVSKPTAPIGTAPKPPTMPAGTLPKPTAPIGTAPKPTMPAVGTALKPTAPAGLVPKPTAPISPVGTVATSPVGTVATSPPGSTAKPDSPASPTGTGQRSNTADFLARYGLKKK